jgi:hypothetical protein
MLHFRKLSGITLFAFALLISVGMLNLASCKKDDTKEEDTQNIQSIKGSVLLNGAFTTFSRSSYYITGTTELQNYLILFRTDNSQITLRFPGTEEGEHTLTGINDSLISIEYKDAGQRLFKADSGRIQVADYKIKDGIFTISGGFEFHASRIEQLGDSTYTVHIRGYEGGFVDISSE